jgi:4-hydroxy-3-methylbut-2-enyl diphosphate reductase
MTKRVLLAAPRGYCAGVDRAVVTVEKALALYGAPVYVRKQIVHNVHVVASLEAKGAIFVEATEDSEILLIGHHGHEEVEGTAGEAPDRVRIVDGLDGARTIQPTPGKNLVWLSQTTLSVDETMEAVAILKERFPDIQAPPSDDICYATQNRQEAIKEIAPQADLVIVVGSRNSSNSVRLVEVALEYGAKASYLVDYAEEIQDEWFTGVETIGLTSGASVPEILVKDVLATLNEHGFKDVQEITAAEESLLFALPPELRKDMKAAGQA